MKRMIVRALASTAAAACLTAGTLTLAAPAHAEYWHDCSTTHGVKICLYNGRLADGRVSISSTLQNNSSGKIFVDAYVLGVEDKWHENHVVGTLKPGKVWSLRKTINATSYNQPVRTAWGIGFGYVDGIEHSKW